MRKPYFSTKNLTITLKFHCCVTILTHKINVLSEIILCTPSWSAFSQQFIVTSKQLISTVYVRSKELISLCVHGRLPHNSLMMVGKCLLKVVLLLVLLQDGFGSKGVFCFVSQNYKSLCVYYIRHETKSDVFPLVMYTLFDGLMRNKVNFIFILINLTGIMDIEHVMF